MLIVSPTLTILKLVSDETPAAHAYASATLSPSLTSFALRATSMAKMKRAVMSSLPSSGLAFG